MASPLHLLISAIAALADGCSLAGATAPAPPPAPASAPIRLAALPAPAAAPRGARAIAGPRVEADAFASVQAAIDALGPAGGTVVLAARTYVVGETILVPSNVAIVGRGPGSVLRLADGADADVLRNASQGGNTNIRLANFRIDGNRAGQAAKSDGILLVRVTDSSFEDLTVGNCSGHGINLSSHCMRNVVRGCTASDNGYTAAWATSGIMVTYHSTGNLIERNACHRNNAYLAPSGKESWDGNGIRIGDHADRNTVRDNACDGNGRRGIKIQASHNVVTGNTCTGNLGSSIFLGGGPTTHNLVEGNVIRAWRLPGIQLSANATDNTIARNVITGTYHGIEAGFGAQRNQLLGNTIARTRLNGIYLHGTSDNVVEGNTITDSGQFSPANGIRITYETAAPTSRNRVVGNVATDTQPTKTQRFGLLAEVGTADTTVVGNDFRGNQAAGMRLDGGTLAVSGNRP